MAIVQTGSTLDLFLSSTANTGTVSSSITVPSDAEIVIVGINGYQGTDAGFASMTFTKGGVDTAMTKIAADGSAFWQAAAFYLNAPDTGSSKTLKWDWIGTGTSVDGSLHIVARFYKGIDT